MAANAATHCPIACAQLGDALFWASLANSLAISWAPTFFVNRALIARGRGHAVAHAAHHG